MNIIHVLESAPTTSNWDGAAHFSQHYIKRGLSLYWNWLDSSGNTNNPNIDLKLSLMERIRIILSKIYYNNIHIYIHAITLAIRWEEEDNEMTLTAFCPLGMKLRRLCKAVPLAFFFGGIAFSFWSAFRHYWKVTDNKQRCLWMIHFRCYSRCFRLHWNHDHYANAFTLAQPFQTSRGAKRKAYLHIYIFLMNHPIINRQGPLPISSLTGAIQSKPFSLQPLNTSWRGQPRAGLHKSIGNERFCTHIRKSYEKTLKVLKIFNLNTNTMGPIEKYMHDGCNLWPIDDSSHRFALKLK